MAKLEIPSIVVQSGSRSQVPPVMDRSTSRDRPAPRTWTLGSKSTYEEDADSEEPINGETDQPAPAAGEKEDETKNTNNNNLPRNRTKGHMKFLQRSHAIKESTSPPPDVPLSPVATSPTDDLPNPPPSNNNNPSTMNVNGLTPRPTIKREGSNQSSDSNWSSSLSRGNSMEQQSSETGQVILNLEQFLADTVNGHAKNRIFLLRIESEIISIIKDIRKTSHKFGIMSSYQRMLVHRVAHYYGLEHNVDSTGQMVVVTKCKSTKIPAIRLNDFIRDDLLLSEEPRKSILKRDSASFEDTVSFKSPDRHTADAPRRSKSFEEREEEYEKVRARIFHPEHGDHNHDGCPHDCEDELRWPQVPPPGPWEHTEYSWRWYTSVLFSIAMWFGLFQGDHNHDGCPDDCEEDLRWPWDYSEFSDSTKLHPNSHRPSRLTKVESYESKDTLRANSLRSSVSKSYSFGGYDQSSNNRVLTKQDSGSSVSSRVSPSSSGYKSQSQRSDTTMSATPSPTATPHLTTQLSNQSGAFSPDIEQDTVMWAVTSMASVPAGSVLINPQTGQPIKNEDGSLYHYDPDNPPKRNGTAESVASAQQTCENGMKSENVTCVASRGPQNETNGPSEPPATTTNSAPALPPATSYHHAEVSNHTESESGASAMPPAHMPSYHHAPPPAPTAPMPHMTANASTYTATMMYNPAAAPYNVVMQPPSLDGYAAPQTNAQPIIYGLPPTATGQQYTPVTVTGAVTQYDRGINTMENQDLCSYMMGLSLGDMNRSEVQHRQTVYYCHQPAHYSQATGQAAVGPTVPVYFTPPNTAPPQQPATHQPRYAQCAYQYAQPAERPATECTYPQPQPQSQPTMHSYYSRCPPRIGRAQYRRAGTGRRTAPWNRGRNYNRTTVRRMSVVHNGSSTGTTATYCGPSGGAPGAAIPMGLVLPPTHAQTARPYHRMPTPPNTPQNGCAQYSMYTAMAGCYPHYQAASQASQMPLPPMMRPAMQLNVGNSPPLRAMRTSPYNPAVRDPAPPDPQRHSASPMRYAASVTPGAPAPHYFYRFSFPANELLLMNNNRAPFVTPPTANRLPTSVALNFPNIRRHRPRAVGASPNNGRPMFTASQQQAALATAIEAAGNHDPMSGGHGGRNNCRDQ